MPKVAKYSSSQESGERARFSLNKKAFCEDSFCSVLHIICNESSCVGNIESLD